MAERTYDAELGAVNNSARGLKSAMALQFRMSVEEERLNVLKAHPDLVGRLAVAKRLTVESTAEQASVGLNKLTAEEHAELVDELLPGLRFWHDQRRDQQSPLPERRDRQGRIKRDCP